MSKTVDNRVVEMRFDNEQFERGIRQSTKSLNGLQESLKFMDKPIGLDGLTKAINNLDLSSISNGIESISKRFSTLGVIGMTVVSNLTTSAMNAISNVSRNISGLIIEGGKNRAANIENAKFQLEGLGIAYKDVFDAIDYAVTNTAYSLDAAAQAASQFATAGLDYRDVVLTHKSDNKELTQMAIALRAVSGVAAQTQSDYARVARYFQDVATAGKVTGSTLTYMTQVLNLPVAHDLADGLNEIVKGSYEASDAVVANAKKITKGATVSANDIAELCKEGLISFDTFSTIMFNKYADHAVDANKTITGVTANIKSAFARIGEMFISPIIANEGPLVNMLEQVRLQVKSLKPMLEPLAKAFTSLANNGIRKLTKAIQELDFTKYVKNFSDGIIYMMNAFDSSNINLIIKNIKDLFFAVQSYVGPIKEAFTDIFEVKFNVNVLRNFLVSLNEVINKFKLTEQGSERLRSIFRALFAVVDIAKQAFDALLIPIKTIFKLFGLESSNIFKATNAFSYFVVCLDEAIRESKIFEKAAQKISDVIVVTAIVLKVTFGKAINFVKNAIAELSKLDFSSVTNFFKSVSETFSNGGNGFKFSDVFSGLLDIFHNIIKLATTALKLVTQLAKTIAGGLIEALKNADSSIIKDGIIAYLITKLPDALYSIKLFLGTIESGFKSIFNIGFKDKINKIFKSLTDTMEEFQDTLKAESIKSLAIAIGILTLALVTLSGIDAASLTKSAIAIGVLFTELKTALNGINFDNLLSKNPFDNRLATTLVAFAASIIILSGAVKSLSKIDFLSLAKSMVSIEILMASMVGVINNIPTTKLTKASGLLIAFALSLRIMASAIKSLSKSAKEGEAFLDGFLVLEAMMFSLVIVIKALSAQGDKLLKAGSTILSIAIAMKIMSSAMKSLTESAKEGEAFLDGFLVLEAMMFSLVIVIKALSAQGDKLLKAGSTILAISISLRIMASAMKSLTESAKEGEAFLDAFLVIEGMLFSLVLAAQTLSDIGPKILLVALGLIGMAASVKIMASALNELDNASNAIKSAGAIAIVAGVLAGFSFLSEFLGEGVIIGALGLIAFAHALKVLVPPLLELANADIGKVAGHLSAFLGIMLGFGAIATIFPELAIGLGIIDAALLLFGLACLSAGSGMEKFGLGMYTFAKAIDLFSSMGNRIETGAQNLVNAFVITISSLIPTLIEFVITGFGAVCDAIVANAPKLVEVGKTLIDVFIESLSYIKEKFPIIVDLGVELISQFISGLGKAKVSLINAAFETIIDFINGLAEAIDTHTPELISAVDNLIDSVIRAIELWFDTFVSKGEGFISSLVTGVKGKISDLTQAAIDAVKGFIKGLKDKAKDIVKAGKDFGKDFLDGFRDITGWHSPWMMDAAKDAVAGYTGEIESERKLLENSGVIFGSSFMEGADNSLANGGEGFLAILSNIMARGESLVKKGTRNINFSFQNSVENVDIFDGSVRKTGETVEKTSKSMDTYSGSLDKVSSKSKAAKEETDSLLESIKGQMDIFSEFNKDSDLTADKLLENMESQISGVTEWAESISKLAIKGIDQGLLEKLANMGPQGYKYTSAFVSMTEEQLAKANLLFQRSLIIPEQANFQAKFAMQYAGQMLSEGLMTGINTHAAEKKSSEMMGNTIDAAKKVAQINSPSVVMFKMGEYLCAGLNNGISDKISTVVSQGIKLASNLTNVIRNRLSFDEYRMIGFNAATGLSKGIQDGSSGAINSAISMAKNVLESAKKALDIHSPSKAFEKLGFYSDMGLANGFYKYVNIASDAAYDVGSEVINSMQAAIDKVSLAIDGSIDSNPVIRPIVDLGDVINGTSRISDLIDNTTMKIGSFGFNNFVPSRLMDNQINTNNSNKDIVSAITSLREDVTNLGNTMSRMQMVLDTGTLVGEIAAPIDTALGQRAVYAGRGN